MNLYTVRARSIYRKSRADEGKLAVWLVPADTEDHARTRWREAIIAAGGEWVIEALHLNITEVIRIH